MTEQEKKEIEQIIISEVHGIRFPRPSILATALAAYIDKRDEERLGEVRRVWDKYKNYTFGKNLKDIKKAISNLAKEMKWETQR